MKIGIYDSGIGGLFVLFSLAKRFPEHDYLYLGDQANAPYGTKSKQELLALVSDNLRWFKKMGANKVIIACNTACSSGALDIKIQDLEIEGIIDKTVAQLTEDKNASILVLATPLTIANRAYQKKIEDLGYTHVYGHPLKDLAYLIEADSSIEELDNYLQKELSAIEFKPDCVVLGCTHYPLVKDKIEDFFKARVIDSSDLDFNLGEKRAPQLTLYTTKNPEVMQAQIERIFNLKVKVKQRMKIIVVSDNHGRKEGLSSILNKHLDASGFIHCGDSEMNYRDLEGYVSVRGNNDFDFDYPNERIIEYGDYRILVIHGHRNVYLDNRTALVEKAKLNNCQIVCFGHTHVYEFQKQEGIYLLNPGSLHHNRDGSRPSYAILTIDEKGVNAERKTI